MSKSSTATAGKTALPLGPVEANLLRAFGDSGESQTLTSLAHHSDETRGTITLTLAMLQKRGCIAKAGTRWVRLNAGKDELAEYEAAVQKAREARIAEPAAAASQDIEKGS